MNKRDTAADINDQAARWALKLESGASDAESAAGLEGWLAQDPRRQGALLRAQAALSLLDRGRALQGTIRRPERLPLWTRRRLLATGSGFGAMAAAWGGWAVLVYHPTRYSTEFGQVRRVQLPDGSLAAINTDSTVSVDIDQTLRLIELTKGEAWFEVVKDARRPFVVAAGRVRARAVGTAFSVRRHDDGADVLVTEGTVETWIVGQQERSRLTAGMRAFVADYAPPQPVARPAEIERALAWRDGQISLEGERLADAVEEFNRYNTKKLVIVDPNLAEERLVGRFSIHEPIAFARAVKSALGATVSEDHDTIQLARR